MGPGAVGEEVLGAVDFIGLQTDGLVGSAAGAAAENVGHVRALLFQLLPVLRDLPVRIIIIPSYYVNVNENVQIFKIFIQI